jgi:hypothetical protein
MKTVLLIASAMMVIGASAAEPAQEAKSGQQRVHSDPRFKGKVIVEGTTSESFGEAPAGEKPKTTRIEMLEPEAAAPKPLPPPPAKR